MKSAAHLRRVAVQWAVTLSVLPVSLTVATPLPAGLQALRQKDQTAYRTRQSVQQMQAGTAIANGLYAHAGEKLLADTGALLHARSESAENRQIARIAAARKVATAADQRLLRDKSRLAGLQATEVSQTRSADEAFDDFIARFGIAVGTLYLAMVADMVRLLRRQGTRSLGG